MKNRPRPRHPTRIPQRGEIEVPHPHAHRDVARVADRPVVAIRLRRPGLHRHGKREVERPTGTEDVLARGGIGKDVGDPERRPLRDQPFPRHAHAAASERRVSPHELLERHLGVAEGQAETVVLRRPVEVPKPRGAQEAQQRRGAELRQELHRRNILRAGEGQARA